MRQGVIVALATIAIIGRAGAADITVEPGEDGTMNLFRLSGEITSEDPRRLEEAIATVEKTPLGAWMILNSPGGDVMAAIKLGRLVRDNAMLTVVQFEGGCDSACALVFVAGVDRIAGGSDVGVHRPRFDEEYFSGLSEPAARDLYEKLTAQVQAYLADMGADSRLFRLMMSIPSGQVRRLTLREMEELGVVGWDPSYEEWLRARNVKKHGQERWAAYEACRQTPAYVEFQDAQAWYAATCVGDGHDPGACYLEAERRFADPCAGLLSSAQQ